MKDYYYILGISKDASMEEVKKAYRKLSQKFHPDKNDGDLFFAERFKDINEAYETLSNPQKRRIFDLSYGKVADSDSPSRTNFVPVVDYFRVNKDVFEYDEKLTFSWRTVNATNVKIRPFGEVESIGQRTFQIKDYKHKTLTFTLVAENRNIERYTEASITLKNKTFENFYTQILAEMKKSSFETDINSNPKDIEDKIRNKIHAQYSENLSYLSRRINQYESKSKKHKQVLTIISLLAVILVLLSFPYSRGVVDEIHGSETTILKEELKTLEIQNAQLTDSLTTLNNVKRIARGSSSSEKSQQNSINNSSNSSLSKYSNARSTNLVGQSQPVANNLNIRPNQYVELSNVEWTHLYDGVYNIESLTIKNKSARIINRVKYNYTVVDKYGQVMESGKWMLPSDGSDELIAPGNTKRVPFSNSDVRITLSQKLIITIDEVITQ